MRYIVTVSWGKRLHRIGFEHPNESFARQQAELTIKAIGMDWTTKLKSRKRRGPRPVIQVWQELRRFEVLEPPEEA